MYAPSSNSHRWKHDAMNRRTSALSFSFSRGSICGILRLLLPLTLNSCPTGTPAAAAPGSGSPAAAPLQKRWRWLSGSTDVQDCALRVARLCYVTSAACEVCCVRQRCRCGSMRSAHR